MAGAPEEIKTAAAAVEAEATAAPESADALLIFKLLSLVNEWYKTVRPLSKKLGESHLEDLWRHVWFAKGEEQKKLDVAFKTYEPLMDAFKAYVPDEGKSQLVQTMALIILYDQITRNIHRGTAKAYSGDERARGFAKSLLANAETFRALPTHFKVTICVCLVHSEDIKDHETVSNIIAQLEQQKELHGTSMVLGSLKQIAQNHRDRVSMFGRIPERNKYIGRESTEKERIFMRAVSKATLM